ncbi:hypothetical protein [Rhizohabitans arisaemae]|uniref:hypothetical protein n=1 Tax=Rhizohabitans arisaemae TaxID=2720610 RepID=UPI0024B08540|nr:hypothetical protein [Rhizohabitans arisaemae]
MSPPSGAAYRVRSKQEETMTEKTPQGSAAEEALRLLDALQQRVGREFAKGFIKGGFEGFTSRGSRTRGDVWSEAVNEPEYGDGEYICRACPVCRAIAASRGSGPDVADQVASVGGEFLTAVRGAFDVLTKPRTQPRTTDDDEDDGLG